MEVREYRKEELQASGEIEPDRKKDVVIYTVTHPHAY